MKPTREQLVAALTKSPISFELGGVVSEEDGRDYYAVARSFIAASYWDVQRTLRDIRNLIDRFPTDPDVIHEIELILEEKIDENLR